MHPVSSSNGGGKQRRSWQVRCGLIIVLLVSLGLGIFISPQTDAAGADIRINAGGGGLTIGGVIWDQCYGVNTCQGWVNTGYLTAPNPAPPISNVAAPASPAVYQAYWSTGNPSFTFNITVTNGPYLVRLHFAELLKTAAGQRIFDVQLEGSTVLDNFDVFAVAGGQNRAVVREFPVEISDTHATIQVLRQTDNPTISGIEIISLAPPTPTPTTISSPGATTLFSWTSGANVPQARFEAQGAAVNGKLYVIGGFINTQAQATSLVDVYDVASNTWQRIANIPEAISHAPVVVDGSTIYVLGGYRGDNPGASTNHVWKLNTSTNTWSAGPNLPAARGGAGAARVGRNLHFFGGATRTQGILDDTDQADHYVLNLDTGVWTSAPDLPNPRNHMAGVALNGKVYALGGQHAKFEESANQVQVDVYDPATSTWSRAADLPTPKGHTSASTFVVDGRIMVIGGSLNGGSNGLAADDVLLYDPLTNVWLMLPPIPAIRKTPVADIIGDVIVVATGGGYGPTNTIWRGTLPNTWETAAAMPAALGEVAGGIINNRLYLVGESSPATLSYNLSTNAYSSTGALAQREFKGNHHTAEVIGGKLYLFGGLGAGGDKVQIYDPATNSWALGADMPFAAGSGSSALIGGQVYVAGGISGATTTNRLARYNPASNTWAELAPMPQGRNHAAAATDGSKLYIFGGRGPGSGDGNTVANGFDTVQIYDPATNTWQSSLDPGSTLAPLPQARGGMGRAIYHNGEMYVLGGETTDGAGATTLNVYRRVDIYNPTTNTWREGIPMPTARHGIFPLLIGKRIYVGGGGIQAGGSSAALMEIYNPGPAPGSQPVTTTPTLTATTVPTATGAPPTVTPITPTATWAPTLTPTTVTPITPTPTGSPTLTPTGSPTPITPTPNGSPSTYWSYFPLIVR